MINLRLRPQLSQFWIYGSPFLALFITMVIGALLFFALGINPVEGISTFLWLPIHSTYALTELVVKATPLLIMALGLCVSLRTNVFNIGAEGQYVMGAIFATGVALQAQPDTSPLFLLLVLLAGLIGGGFWASIVAYLRDRFHASEILVSLMLVYVAIEALLYFVSGPWKDPQGYNFPQTKLFDSVVSIPILLEGTRLHWGLFVGLLGAVILYLFIFHTYSGFAQGVGGSAPKAAQYAGFSTRRGLWIALLTSGGAAGLAGAIQVAGPIGQLTPHFPMGYGFAAIIIAYIGRLHPIGTILSSLLLSMFYLGGEMAQTRLGLPQSLTNLFQGLLLFTFLATDTLIRYQIFWKRRGD
jgi:simple sugar transport system permease protein